MLHALISYSRAADRGLGARALPERTCLGGWFERDDRHLQPRNGNSHGQSRVKLHADIAHPINADCRHQIEDRVLKAYQRELERSTQPGYVAPALDGEDFEFLEDLPGQAQGAKPSDKMADQGC